MLVFLLRLFAMRERRPDGDFLDGVVSLVSESWGHSSTTTVGGGCRCRGGELSEVSSREMNKSAVYSSMVTGADAVTARMSLVGVDGARRDAPARVSFAGV